MLQYLKQIRPDLPDDDPLYHNTILDLTRSAAQQAAAAAPRSEAQKANLLRAQQAAAEESLQRALELAVSAVISLKLTKASINILTTANYPNVPQTIDLYVLFGGVESRPLKGAVNQKWFALIERLNLSPIKRRNSRGKAVPRKCSTRPVFHFCAEDNTWTHAVAVQSITHLYFEICN